MQVNVNCYINHGNCKNLNLVNKKLRGINWIFAVFKSLKKLPIIWDKMYKILWHWSWDCCRAWCLPGFRANAKTLDKPTKKFLSSKTFNLIEKACCCDKIKDNLVPIKSHCASKRKLKYNLKSDDTTCCKLQFNFRRTFFWMPLSESFQGNLKRSAQHKRFIGCNAKVGLIVDTKRHK